MERTQLQKQFKRGATDNILRTYLRLHERTGRIIGEHWIWCALERIAAGEPEERVLNDYMYIYSGPKLPKPYNPSGNSPPEAA